MSEELKTCQECVDKCLDVVDALLFCYTHEPCLKILKLLASVPKPLYTRQIILYLRPEIGTTHGHRILTQMEKAGLIERKRRTCEHDPSKNCIYNELTALGKLVWELYEKLTKG